MEQDSNEGPKEIPEGYVEMTLSDGRQEIVPECPEGEDPVDFYSSLGIQSADNNE